MSHMLGAKAKAEAKPDGGGEGGGAGCDRNEARCNAGEYLHHGIVRPNQVDPIQGYIECLGPMQTPAGELTPHVWAGKEVLSEVDAQVGDTVAFFVQAGPLVKIACAEPGQYALKGVIKEGWDGPEGFGFIECDVIKDYFYQDVYVDPDILVTPLGRVVPGQEVRFNAYLDFPWVCCKDLQGRWSKVLSPLTPEGIAAAPVETTSQGKTAVTDIWLKGTVKSNNPVNKYGFIECPEVKEQWGGLDVFCPMDKLAGFARGTQVLFKLGTSTTSAKPQASPHLNNKTGRGTSWPRTGLQLHFSAPGVSSCIFRPRVHVESTPRARKPPGTKSQPDWLERCRKMKLFGVRVKNETF